MADMSTARAVDPKAYARLLTRTLPAPIESEKDYEQMLAQVDALMERDEDDLSPAESKLLDLLTMLIERYEDQRYPPRAVTPHGMVHHLMDARGLKHKDIWPLFGSKGVASDVLNGKRAISKAHAKRLAAFFHVSAALFI
jgi:HTH-type transcriptional regulator/antitoxin HigA